MRYYDILLTRPGSATPVRHWGTQINGAYNPNAQNIEFDILNGSYDNPMGAQSLEIEGVDLKDLGNAQQFTGLQFTMKAGMQKGLPLANPAQQGTITSGLIFQSYGNWQGTDMTLNFVITPSAYSYQNAGNIVLNWPKNTWLGTAIKNALSVAYPGVPVDMNISQNFVQPHDETGFSATLEQFAQNIADRTKSDSDPGVVITLQSGKFIIYDSTYTPTTIKIAFNDMIGQPTWIAPNTIMIKLVMRGDIALGDLIQLPVGMQNVPGMTLMSADSMPSSMKYQSTFQSIFRVKENRHVGNFRSSDGASWATLLTCVPANG